LPVRRASTLGLIARPAPRTGAKPGLTRLAAAPGSRDLGVALPLISP